MLWNRPTELPNHKRLVSCLETIANYLDELIATQIEIDSRTILHSRVIRKIINYLNTVGDNDFKITNIVEATGLGKSWIMGYLIIAAVVNGIRVCISTDSLVNLKALESRISSMLNSFQLEGINLSAAYSNSPYTEESSEIVVTTHETLRRIVYSPQGLNPFTYGLLLVDEADLMTSERRTEAVNRLAENGCIIFGATATSHNIEQRGDVFGDTLDRTTISDSIIEGMSNPVRVIYLMVESAELNAAMDSDVSYSPEHVERITYDLGIENAIVQLILKEFSGDKYRQIKIKANTINQADRLAKLLTDSGILAESYHSGMHSEDRDRVIDLQEEGRIQVVVDVESLGRGWDFPSLDTAMSIAISTSMTVVEQDLGRITRKQPGKATSLYIQLVHESSPNQVTPYHILEGISVGRTVDGRAYPRVFDIGEPRDSINFQFPNLRVVWGIEEIASYHGEYPLEEIEFPLLDSEEYISINEFANNLELSISRARQILNSHPDYGLLILNGRLVREDDTIEKTKLCIHRSIYESILESRSIPEGFANTNRLEEEYGIPSSTMNWYINNRLSDRLRDQWYYVPGTYYTYVHKDLIKIVLATRAQTRLLEANLRRRIDQGEIFVLSELPEELDLTVAALRSFIKSNVLKMYAPTLSDGTRVGLVGRDVRQRIIDNYSGRITEPTIPNAVDIDELMQMVWKEGITSYSDVSFSKHVRHFLEEIYAVAEERESRNRKPLKKSAQSALVDFVAYVSRMKSEGSIDFDILTQEVHTKAGSAALKRYYNSNALIPILIIYLKTVKGK